MSSNPLSSSGESGANLTSCPWRHEIVALDKANEGKDTDYQNVVAAEWDAVELASENVTGGQCRSDHRANFCHGELPDGRGRFVRSAILVLNLPA
jgi:hypothetical protein